MLRRIRKWYENKTFAKKIFYSCLIFCIIPFLIATLITSFFFVNILIERTNKNIEDSNNKIAVLINNRFSQCEYVVDNLICDSTFLCLVQEKKVFLTAYEINQYLNERISEMQIAVPEIEELTIYADTDLENEMIKPLSLAAQNNNLSYAVKQQFSTWYTEDGDVYAAYPIKNPYSRTSLGVIAIKFDLKKLIQDYTQISFDEYAVYLYGPNGDNIYTKEVFPFEIGKITERMLKNDDSRLYAAGRYFIENHITLPEYHINLYCIVPEASVYGPIWNYLMIPLTVWLICFIFIIFLCIFLSRSLSKRIRRLEFQMMRFSNGDLTGFEPENINDEIGNISAFCSQAVCRLNQLINETYVAQIKLQQARNDALVAQINPHFLYNTLNMIASFAILSENTVIADAVTQLSNYYRTTLNKGKSLISIEEELINVKAYCNLQLLLHDRRFSIDFKTDKSIYCFTTINLCLQPLVENAIEHGVNNLPEGEGYIKITALTDGEVIRFTVTNNGAPELQCDPNSYLQLTSKGYGLKNIQDRIHIAFGEEYGLQLSCKNGVFTAVLTIPTQIKNPYIENFETTDNNI